MSASDERDSKPLRMALRALDDDDRRHLSTSATVEARLLAEVRALAWAHRRRRMHTAIASAAAAVIVATGVWVSSWPTDVASRGRHAQAAEVGTAFMPLMYGDVPMTEGHLVRLEVPRLALTTFGLAPREVLDVDAARGTVLVDVLVGEDGLARAVRFVHASSRAGSSRP
jgi:hypothetical protein